MRSWLRAFRAWLDDTDIPDPVDRRNAPALQVLLALIGLLALFNVALFTAATVGSQRHVAPDKAFALASMLIVGVVSWISFATIRTGRLHLAVKIFVASLLIALAMVYTRIGIRFLSNEPLALLPLGIGGLVLGRRVLWQVVGALCVICVLSVTAEVLRTQAHSAQDIYPLAGLAFSSMGTFLLIAILLDRTVAALRESLADSNEKQVELADALAQLHIEISERERAQGQLIHAKKMDVVGRLAAGIAHDFGNIISIIHGFASRRDALADRGMNALISAMAGIDKAAQRADIINRRLMNFSRLQHPSEEDFDAVDALEELTPMIRQLFPSRVVLDVRLQCQRAMVRMDRGHFDLALFNIASNARDAMPADGVFSIVCRVTSDRLLVELSDTGVGISSEVMASIFEPFYTTKPVGQGTGLGLSMTSEMLKGAGGSVHVASKSGEGTTFSILLPLQM